MAFVVVEEMAAVLRQSRQLVVLEQQLVGAPRLSTNVSLCRVDSWQQAGWQQASSSRSTWGRYAAFGLCGATLLHAEAAETHEQQESVVVDANPHCACGGCDPAFFKTPRSECNILKMPLRPIAQPNEPAPARKGFYLRPATRADMPVILKMMQLMAGSEFADHIQEVSAKLEVHLFGDQPYAELLVGELDGEPIAFCLYYFTYSFFRVQPKIHLEDCWVDPKHRGKRYASQIASHLFNVAVDRGCCMVEWDVELANTRAVEFFRGFGAEVPTDWVPIRVVGDDMVALAKSADFKSPRSSSSSWFSSVRRFIGL